MGVPAASREQAWQRLTESRALWRFWRKYGVDFHLSGVPPMYRGHAYSYVRARQTSSSRLELTLVAVDASEAADSGRVAVRAFVTADPEQLNAHAGAKAQRLRSEWVERGAALGSHETGAPARTVDQLYDDCAALLSAHASLAPHLYFHPNGVLMHCGFTREECGDCQEISVESVSHYSFDWEWPREDPAKWVCGTPWGVFAPGTEIPELGSSDQCMASYAPRTSLPPSLVSATGAGLGDICAVDRAACPELAEHSDGQAYWGWLNVPCTSNPARSPTALELGKAAPFATWAFPFFAAYGVECGDSANVPVERRITPTLQTKQPAED